MLFAPFSISTSRRLVYILLRPQSPPAKEPLTKGAVLPSQQAGIPSPLFRPASTRARLFAVGRIVCLSLIIGRVQFRLLPAGIARKSPTLHCSACPTSTRPAQSTIPISVLTALRGRAIGRDKQHRLAEWHAAAESCHVMAVPNRRRQIHGSRGGGP